MSTAKKRRTGGKVDPVPTANKKVKVDLNDDDSASSNATAASDTISVQWEHEGAKNKWIKHTAGQNKIISTALRDGKPSIEIKHKNANLVVTFDKMMQRNTVTGWEKRIRCVPSGADDIEYVWQWMEKKAKWTTYSQSTVYLLETAHMHGVSSVTFPMMTKQATVDLKNNLQTLAGNKTKKQVRRIKSDLADAPPAKDSISDVATPNLLNDTKVKKEPSGKKDSTKAPKVNEEAVEMKSLTFSGKAPVDSHCTIKDKVHVFCEGTIIWDTMLNQTNVMNNNNKFYLIQLVEDNVAKKYYTWMRWGRVGFDGQKGLQSFGADLEKAKDTFEKKFKDKTKNDWEDRDQFTKVPGKYDLLIMDYKAEEPSDEVDAAPVKEEKPAIPDSKLDVRVRALVELICNIQAMEEILKEMKYDTKKAPLGKLTTEQIKAGYEALKAIESCISRNDFGKALVKACDEFYTRIPHCFGMKRPPLLRTTEEVKKKLELLEALGDIQIAVTMLKEKVDCKLHPVDRQYQSLHCDLTPLDHAHQDFKMVKSYVENTHALTHNQYNMEVLDVFAVHHQKDDFLDVDNRMLLWHGSRLTNWAGILSQGLRIAPPEAPVTGYMFGKGIYFADMCSKSANYCFATRSKNTGIVLLSEVSLGKSNELLKSNYNAASLPKGHHSVKALGKVGPDPSQNIVRSDGLIVPCGKSIETGVVNPNGYTLNYNEYIVYDTRQVRMRYLVKLKFNFK